MLKSPSNWLLYCLNIISYKKDKLVLDLACGRGRHSVFLSNLGFYVVSVDISEIYLNSFNGSNIEKICKDVENIKNWPLYNKLFDIVLVTNFLNREIFPFILNSICHGGDLIYETFSQGNQKFGKPRNKKFILRTEELLEITQSLSVICYERLKVESYFSGSVKQRILVKNV